MLIAHYKSSYRLPSTCNWKGYKTPFHRLGHNYVVIKSVCIVATDIHFILQFVDLCNQPVDPGNCECFIPYYFWNTTSESCELFIYGGCDGNSNRFPDLSSCAKQCGKHLAPC